MTTFLQTMFLFYICLGDNKMSIPFLQDFILFQRVVITLFLYICVADLKYLELTAPGGIEVSVQVCPIAGAIHMWRTIFPPQTILNKSNFSYMITAQWSIGPSDSTV